jgi:hypothetical protein
MTEYIFSENSKAITNASAPPTYNKKQSKPPTYASQATQRWDYKRKDPNFDSLVQFFEVMFSFHDPENTTLLPSETSVAIYQPTWHYISKEMKLNKHHGESCTIYMQHLTLVNDGPGLSQLSIQRGYLCADSETCWLC